MIAERFHVCLVQRLGQLRRVRHGSETVRHRHLGPVAVQPSDHLEEVANRPEAEPLEEADSRPIVDARAGLDVPLGARRNVGVQMPNPVVLPREQLPADAATLVGRVYAAEHVGPLAALGRWRDDADRGERAIRRHDQP